MRLNILFTWVSGVSVVGSGNGEKNYHVKAVITACNLMKLFLEKPEWNVKELCERVELHRSSIHRIMDTLVATGFIEKNPGSGKYKLGMTALQIGLIAMENMELRSVALPIMKELRELTQETVDLSIFVDNNEVLFIEHLESPQLVKIGSEVGYRVPVHCTAPGKIFLAFSDELDENIVLTHPLLRLTKNTITDVEILKIQLMEVRKREIAFDLGERWEEVAACGSPIWDSRGKVIAALSVPGPIIRMMEQLEGELPEMVRNAALNISKRLGYMPANRG